MCIQIRLGHVCLYTFWKRSGVLKMSMLETQVGLWAPKPPFFFLISLKERKSNFHKKLARISDATDQDEQL